MAEYANREHYIPIRRSDLVSLLVQDKQFPVDQKESFRQFCRLITGIFHFEYHDQLESLKDEYAAFDPDTVTNPIDNPSSIELAGRVDTLFEKFTWLMGKANYTRMTREQLLEATEAASDWGLNLDIDFSLFDQLEVFYRGDSKGFRLKRHWLLFWKSSPVSVPVYQRVAVIFKPKENHKRLGMFVDENAIFLKLFKDIPKDDIEMLLPGGTLKMPKIALGKLGASLVGAIGFVGYKLLISFPQLLAATLTLSLTSLFAFVGPVSLVAGYGYKQYAGYQQARRAYSLQLAQSLYYQNLDSNGGVLFHLLDEAEEQECREAILAYYYLLLRAPEQGWTSDDLDEYVEMDLERLADIKVDFEIGDALGKLERLGLVESRGERYVAVPLNTALEKLDYRWDNYFTYNQANGMTAERGGRNASIQSQSGTHGS